MLPRQCRRGRPRLRVPSIKTSITVFWRLVSSQRATVSEALQLNPLEYVFFFFFFVSSHLLYFHCVRSLLKFSEVAKFDLYFMPLLQITVEVHEVQRSEEKICKQININNNESNIRY